VGRPPWPEAYQVEQDLILSRLMIEIAEDELLGSELVMRGGTCLHKVHLNEAWRYSEDLDYVRRSGGGIGPYLDGLRELAARIGLAVSTVDFSGQMVHVVLDVGATGGGGIRIKIEMNIAETEFFKEAVALDYEVDSSWWRGEASIPTFALDEMMSTKLRALYQRRKGRDLFDLWLVLTYQNVSADEIVNGLRHYMRDDTFTYPQLRQNLFDKLSDTGFRSDIETLVVAVPDGYAVDLAADLAMEQLGSRLDHASPLDEIRGDGWRG
jgi:predicted nucleotidyltransferase component of viral defense system